MARININYQTIQYRTVITKQGYISLPKECIANDMDNPSSFILTDSMNGGLCLYTREDFKNMQSEINKLNSLNPQARELKRRLVGNASVVFIEKRRCIKIPSELLLILGIDTNQDEIKKRKFFRVMLIKHPHRIEIIPLFKRKQQN